MKKLGDLLGSPARTEVLRALMCQPAPIGLRHAARIAAIHPHSAELALAGLARDRLVRRERSDHRIRYALNRDHEAMPVLEAVFAAAARALIRARSRSLGARARGILPFIEQAQRMLACARANRHVA